MRHIPSEVPLGPEDGLPKPCVANLDTITTIAKRSLRERLVPLSPEKLKAVEAALHFALGQSYDGLIQELVQFWRDKKGEYWIRRREQRAQSTGSAKR